MPVLASWDNLRQAWQGKQVLVTGAGGFIGSHLSETLVSLGANVQALVEYNSAGSWDNLEYLPEDVKANLQVTLGELNDPFQMQRLIHPRLDAVFHLAALIGIPYSYTAPKHYVDVNVNGTLNVLEACLKADGPRLVHTSTSETYGTAQYAPIDEQHPLQGQSPYSASKIGADMLAESYYRSFGLPVSILRPFNTFGPRQSARAFIPAVITQALTQTEIQVGDLRPKRDLTYVSDTVRGFLSLPLCDEALGQVTNVGTGQTHSMETVLRTILQVIGKPDLPIVQDETRLRPKKSEVFLLQANAEKAKRLLGWEAEVKLEAGLRKTVEAIEANLTQYKPRLYAR